jgi:hypothetical protein
VADPIGSFQRLLLGNTEAFTIADLRNSLRYIDVDKTFYQDFVDNLPASSELSRDFLIHRFELHHAANYKAHEPMQRLVGELSSLLPLIVADLLEDGPLPAATGVAPLPETLSMATPAEAPALVPVPTFAAAPTAIPLPTAPAPSAPVRPLPDTETASIPLHEKLKASQPAAPLLAETLRATVSPVPLAERASPKVETLREAISINQRFSFINELFAGENMEYHATIQHLDSLPSANEARAYVTDSLSQRYDWSRKEEHVNKLLKLIERRFA